MPEDAPVPAPLTFLPFGACKTSLAKGARGWSYTDRAKRPSNPRKMARYSLVLNAQRPPGSHSRNHDLSAHGLYRTPDQVTCPNTIQAIVDLAGLFGQVAFGLENYALAVFELRDALAKASPFRCAYHSCFLGARV